MRYVILILFFLCYCSPLKGQIIFYQDIFKGGVTGDAYNPWTSPQIGQADIYIEPGSSIRKALLFISSYNNPLDERTIYFNGTPLGVSQQFAVNTSYYHFGSNQMEISTLVLDITHLVSPFQSTYTITPPPNQATMVTEGGYTEFYLYVAYENSSMDEVCAIAAVNNVQPQAEMDYFFQNLNPMDTIQNVSLALHTSAFCDTVQDGSYVLIEGDTIGLIGGDDDHSQISCTGVVGSFYYQDMTLFGLGNDLANTSMTGPDAIANIEPYLTATDEVDISFHYQSNFAPSSNPVHQLFLTYVSTCDEFNTTLSSTQTLCKGDSTQLEATGGIDYEWTPSTGLSCDDCPNPIASPEVSTTYTCHIWSTDSCSKVLPVRVNVSNPEPDTVVVTPATCGSENGEIQVGNVPLSSVSEPPYTYSINGNSQSDTLFANLAGGIYELTVTDANGCTWCDSITVEEEIKTVAFSLIDPKEGHTPFVVTANAGSSINATDYLWLTDNTEIPGEDFEYEYLAADEYDLCLLAWNNEPRCADTTCYKIIVHPEYFVRIPNVFTPNDDGSNDIFSIKIQEVQSIKWQIYNRWGNVLNHGQKDFPTGDFQTLDLWHGDTPQFKPAPDGVYYYKIDVESFGGVVEQLAGHVTLGR